MDADGTVVLRLVGAAALHQVAGGALTCTGGYGPTAEDIATAARLLLQNRPVRIYADNEQAVRSAMAEQALAGDGPDGQGANWQGEPEEVRQ